VALRRVLCPPNDSSLSSLISLYRGQKLASLLSQVSRICQTSAQPLRVGRRCHPLIWSRREGAVNTLPAPLLGPSRRPLGPSAHSKAEWQRLESWSLAPDPLPTPHGQVGSSLWISVSRMQNEGGEVKSVLLRFTVHKNLPESLKNGRFWFCRS
jgi:hypothetical protein